MPQVSVIVPVFNAQQSLGRCINSILSQTFRDLELILVNDGSTDGSEQICRNWAELDPRVKIIEQPNGGVSRARNRGLEEASGRVHPVRRFRRLHRGRHDGKTPRGHAVLRP